MAIMSALFAARSPPRFNRCRVTLPDEAGTGLTPHNAARFHHFLDLRSGASANSLVDVVVIGRRATAADGLATAICVAGEALAPALLAAYPQIRAMLTRLDVTSMTFTAKGLRSPRHRDHRDQNVCKPCTLNAQSPRSSEHVSRATRHTHGHTGKPPRFTAHTSAQRRKQTRPDGRTTAQTAK